MTSITASDMTKTLKYYRK